jgi:hypothetical protein
MMAEGSQVVADYVIQFGKVSGTSVLTDSSGATQWNVTGIAGLDDTLDESEQIVSDEDGERTDNADVFGALGIIGSPLRPTTFDNRDEHAEVACLRTADGLLPLSTRDIRTRMQGNGPNEGTIALVGYGGGFHSISPLLTKSGTNNEIIDSIDGATHVIYCPYDFNSSGVAQKAHSITIDPTSGNESISIVHSGGQAVLLQDDGSIQMQSPNGQSFVKIENGKVTVQADQVILNGSVSIGDPTLASTFPLLAGPTSPPCPRLFLSPTV